MCWGEFVSDRREVREEIANISKLCDIIFECSTNDRENKNFLTKKSSRNYVRADTKNVKHCFPCFHNSPRRIIYDTFMSLLFVPFSFSRRDFFEISRKNFTRNYFPPLLCHTQKLGGRDY